MLAVLRRRLEMAMRVRDFLRAHRTDGLEGAEAAAVARLEELIRRVEALETQQQAGLDSQRESAAQRAAVRHMLQGKLLRYIAALGGVAARENGELGAQFRLPRARATDQAFITLGHGMLGKASEHKALLVSLGMAEQLLDDGYAALARFEQTLEATRAAVRDHVGASADLNETVSAMMQQVRLLDAVVRYRFGDDAELMGAWVSARRVQSPGPSHGATAVPAEVKSAA